VERSADDADRRRTVVAIAAAQRTAVEKWLDGTAAPLARVLEKLQPSERAAFFKAMDLLESELEVDHETPSRAPRRY
jgi:DNA-binding MarR family transcriptional regulator